MADSPSSKANSVAPEIAGQMAGEYRLGRKLGEGGFGTVYEAIHPLLKRRAAVKVLHRIAGSDSEAVLRFVAEARAVNQIRNRHIIDIFSFGKLADGRHFYVMDLLEGEPLDRYIAREGRCSVESVVQLLRPIAEALDAAHAAGVVHRDLKPQNIYLIWDATGETVPKLLDFGMAKLLGESPVHTVSGTPLGTPHYMSPEQARGDLVDGRSDVYALGVLCYELLTGQLPMVGENTIGVLMAHIIQVPSPPSQVCPDLSPELDAPILRMLEKKAELRPATASAALNELSLAAERAGAAVPAGPPRLSRPPPSTEPDRVHSSETADTTLQPFSPASLSFSDPSLGRSGMARSASAANQKRGARWPLWIALIAASALSTIWLTRSWHGAAAPTPAVSAADVATPTPKPSASEATAAKASSTPSASVAPSVAAPEPSAHDSAAAKPVKRALGGAPSSRAHIPSDLESPF
jgi:serine/threonine-protein kinase